MSILLALLGIMVGIAVTSWPRSTGLPKREGSGSATTVLLGSSDDPKSEEINPKTRALGRIVEVGLLQFDSELAARALHAIPVKDQPNGLSFALNEMKDRRCFESEFNGADVSPPNSETARPIRYMAVAFDAVKALHDSHSETKARWGSFLALERVKLSGQGKPSVDELIDFSLAESRKVSTNAHGRFSTLWQSWVWMSTLVLPVTLGGMGVVLSKLLSTGAEEITKAYVKAAWVEKTTGPQNPNGAAGTPVVPNKAISPN